MSQNKENFFRLKLWSFFLLISFFSGTFSWSREITTHLIHLYEQHPNLYLVREKGYHNKNIRQQALEDICHAINTSHLSTLTVGDVSKKIHGLRMTYFTEINKTKKSKASGASVDEVYVPKWQYFDLLHFLNDTAVVRHKGESNLKESEEEADEDIVFEGTLEDLNETYMTPSRSESRTSSTRESTPTQSKPIRHNVKRKDINSQISTLISSPTAAIENISSGKSENSTRNEIFCKMVATEMDEINNEEILDTLKEEIIAALFNAKRQKRQL